MIKVNVFGPTRVEVDGELLPVGALRGRPRQILEILAMASGAPVAKERLADLVWEGNPPAGYHGTLESYVCVLRRALGVRSGRGSVLATGAGAYQLLSPAVSIDLTEFHRRVSLASTSQATTAVALTLESLDLVTGDLLASEPYAGWAERAREVFAHEALVAYVRAAGLANGIRDFESAGRLASAALAQDRLCEAGWQHLIRSHWLAGHRCEALRAYAGLRSTMLEELGDEPGLESRQLYLAILQDPTARPESAIGAASELRTLLRLLRQSLEAIPGVHVPAQDSALGDAAVRALHAVV